MPFSELPAQMLDRVLSMLGPEDRYGGPDNTSLRAAALVSKSWQPVASRHLYSVRSVNLFKAHDLGKLHTAVSTNNQMRTNLRCLSLHLHLDLSRGRMLALLSDTLSRFAQLEELFITCRAPGRAVAVHLISTPPQPPPPRNAAGVAAAHAGTTSGSPTSPVSHLTRVEFTDVPAALTNAVLAVFPAATIDTLQLIQPSDIDPAAPPPHRHRVHSLTVVAAPDAPGALACAAQLVDPQALSRLDVDTTGAPLDAAAVDALVGAHLTHFAFACGPRAHGTLTALPALSACTQLASAAVTARLTLADDAHLWDSALAVLASLPPQTREVAFTLDLHVGAHADAALDHIVAGFDWGRVGVALAHCPAAALRVAVRRDVPRALQALFGRVTGGDADAGLPREVRVRAEAAITGALGAGVGARAVVEVE